MSGRAKVAGHGQGSGAWGQRAGGGVHGARGAEQQGTKRLRTCCQEPPTDHPEIIDAEGTP